MDSEALILLIDESSTGIDAIRRALGDQATHFKLRRVPDVPTALARIWGGGVDMILMNLPDAGSSEGDRLAPFVELRTGAEGVPIVILCASADENLAEHAVREGASDYLIREAYDVDLLKAVKSVTKKPDLSLAFSTTLTGKRGKVLAFMGAKGGVGATTVALNVAAALAQHHQVILAELHSELGTLAHYFQPHRSIRDIGDLLRAEAIAPSAVEACLWPCKNVAGLHVLFGSRNPGNAQQLNPQNARTVLAIAAEFADYVVVDLPVSLSETNRAVFEGANYLALVIERDLISAQAAKLILHSVDSWNAARVSMGAVIVNRSALVSPIPISDIENQLSIPILGIIPPAADLCASAQSIHTPLVTFDIESLPAMALRDLSQALALEVPLPRHIELPGTAPTPMRTLSSGMSRAGVR
jgi:Flp pilus assembly CpaE family ATPase